jgi:PBP4 family serine-type D-alanyl-D-alanine carboxypeptidase
MISRLTFLLISSLLFCGSLFASDPRQTIDSLIALDAARGTSWSVYFATTKDCKEIVSYDKDRMAIPASVTKLWTSAAALDALGPEFRFRTTFYAAGALGGDGALQGDLVVLGGGDPTFEIRTGYGRSKPALDDVAQKLHEAGLRKVRGNILVYGGATPTECAPRVWEIGDLREGFAPAVAGLGFNNNVCNIEIRAGESVGDSVEVRLDPPCAPVNVIRNALTVAPGNDSWIDFLVVPCRDELELRGQIARGDKPQYVWFPLQSPLKYFGLALRDALARRDIEVGGVVETREGKYQNGKQLIEYFSPPLTQMLELINKESDNYTAEYVLRAAGVARHGVGSTEAGLRAVQRFAREAGVTRDDCVLEDGCGLSRQNLVSATALVKMLNRVAASANAQSFESSLSVSGVDGTIGSRLSSDGLLGRVRAKTGTIRHVSALAGYLALDSGEKISFAILANNFRCSRNYIRRIQDEMIRSVFRSVNHSL